jgi:predicted Rdx family selenoprotein
MKYLLLAVGDNWNIGACNRDQCNFAERGCEVTNAKNCPLAGAQIAIDVTRDLLINQQRGGGFPGARLVSANTGKEVEVFEVEKKP